MKKRSPAQWPGKTLFPILNNGVCLVMLCLLMTIMPAYAAGGDVTEAVIYPEGATLTEQAMVTAGDNTHFLPAQARPQTLMVSLGNEQFRITGLTRENVSAAPEESIARLKTALDTKIQEQLEIQDRIKTVSGTIGFWENQIARNWETADDAIQIAASLEAPLGDGYKTKSGLERQLADVEKAIQDLRAKLQNLTGRDHRRWKIIITLTGPENMECPLTFTYFFSDCGFTPFYRLNADMEKDTIAFSWNADIWQRSGRDWMDTAVILTTARPAFDLSPPDMPSWVVGERKPVFARKQAMQDTANFAGSRHLEHTALSEAPVKEIHKTSKQTTTEWRLGKRTIPAGDPQRIHIENSTLPAAFVHLLRPSETEKAFVRATIDLDAPLQAPRGDAIFLINGTMVGQSPFFLQAQEADLFFGTDPLVTATRKLIEKKAGKEGFIRNEQTHELTWETTIENAHAYPVDLRVETPAPQPRDKAITIKRTLTPPVSEKNTTHDTFVWALTVPGGVKETIREAITITAPASMNLDLGV